MSHTGWLRLSISIVFRRFLPRTMSDEFKNQRTNGPVKRSPDIWAKHKIKFGSKWTNHFWEKPVLIFKCKWPWGQGQEVTLTFNTHISSLSQLVSGHRLQNFWKINSFHFFLWISLYYQIWPCRKIGQGQPMVIIWTNYDGQESPMRHTKFLGNQSTGSGEKDFWRVFTIYGHGGHLGNVTTIVSINFHFLVPESLHIKFGFDWLSGFWEKPVLIFKCKWPCTKVKKWPWPSILIYSLPQ